MSPLLLCNIYASSGNTTVSKDISVNCQKLEETSQYNENMKY